MVNYLKNINKLEIFGVFQMKYEVIKRPVNNFTLDFLVLLLLSATGRVQYDKYPKHKGSNFHHHNNHHPLVFGVYLRLYFA
jgi:hypothetical protein